MANSRSGAVSYICPSLSGSWPVAVALAALTRIGGETSTYPALAASSRKKLMSARTSRAPSPMKNGNPAPVTFAPRSKSKSLWKPGTSQWGTALGDAAPVSPWVEYTTLSAGAAPSGTLGCARLGIASMASRNRSSAALSPASLSFTFWETAFISATLAPNSGDPLASAAISAFAAFWTERRCSTSWSWARHAWSAPSTAPRSTSRCFFAIAARTSSGDSRMSLGSSMEGGDSWRRGPGASTAPYLDEARVDVPRGEEPQVADRRLDDVVQRPADGIGAEEPGIARAKDREHLDAERSRQVHRPAVVAHHPVRPLHERRQRYQARVARQVQELGRGERAPVGQQVAAGPNDLARAVLPQDQLRQLLESAPFLVGAPAVGEQHVRPAPAPALGELEAQVVHLPEGEVSAQLRLGPQDRAELEEYVEGVAPAPVRGQGDPRVVENARPLPRVASPHLVLGPRPGRHEPGPQEALHVEHVVEPGGPHLAHQLEEALRARVPLEDKHPVDGLARAHDGREQLAHDPGDAEALPLRLEGRGDLQAHDDVAQGGRLE